MARRTLREALSRTGVESVKVRHRPRLLSDNGPAYVSKRLRGYLAERGMTHTRGRPYHPQTQGKIERYHRSMRNVVKLEHYRFPWQLEQAIRDFVAHSNDELFSSDLLETELLAAEWREGIEIPRIESLKRLIWVWPDRPLTREFRSVLTSGYLRGADLWHLASALFLRDGIGSVDFLSLDKRQAQLA